MTELEMLKKKWAVAKITASDAAIAANAAIDAASDAVDAIVGAVDAADEAEAITQFVYDKYQTELKRIEG